MAGPLSGIKIVELAGLGPAPYACMLLADAGAEIISIGRLDPSADPSKPYFKIENRSRRSVGVNLKHPEGVELILDLVKDADAFIEGFRPGVTERLGVGPEACHAVNPALVYGRMTGWGQDGNLADRAGHDINYIAIAGALWAFGRKDEIPAPPMNLVGDFGGGGMMLAFGITSALLEAKRSGTGQIVDAAMIDGTASMMHMLYGFHHQGTWSEQRGDNLLDTGAFFYEVYETSDGAYMSVGAIEPQFYAVLIEALGLSGEDLPRQNDRSAWPAMKERFTGIFKTKTRSEWTAIFENLDACVFPLLTPYEAPTHPYLTDREVFVEIEGVTQPAPVPRFSVTRSEISRPPSIPGADTKSALVDWGIDEGRIASMKDSGALF